MGRGRQVLSSLCLMTKKVAAGSPTTDRAPPRKRRNREGQMLGMVTHEADSQTHGFLLAEVPVNARLFVRDGIEGGSSPCPPTRARSDPVRQS